MVKWVGKSIAMIGLGVILTGGVVFASTGYNVTSFFSNGQVDINGNALSVPMLYYDHHDYYALDKLVHLMKDYHVDLASRRGILTVTSPYASKSVNLYLDGNRFGRVPELTYEGIPFVNTNELLQNFRNAKINSSFVANNIFLTFAEQPAVYPSSRTISLFDYPQFALGNSNATGSTTTYNNFADNLGNRYTLPTLSWNVPQPASTVTTTNGTGTSVSTAPKYLPFNTQQGTSGTFSRIYNLYGKYRAFVAVLAPSAYLNTTTILANTGSLEIDRGDGNALYTSGNVSSGNLATTRVFVNLTGVRQIQVTFITNGLGLIDPELISN